MSASLTPFENDRQIRRHAALAREEIGKVLDLLPSVLDVQFDRSPASRGERDETGRKVKGGHSDPTPDITLDPARLYVRHTAARCEAHLAHVLIAFRGVRRALERALADWEGPAEEPTVAPPATPAP